MSTIILAGYTRTLKRLARRPISAAGIVLALALGIGISVTMFSVLHGVVLRTLPYAEAERIVVVYTENAMRGVTRGSFTTTEAEEALRGAPGFERIAYFSPHIVEGDQGPNQLQMANVSEEYFAVFGSSSAWGMPRSSPRSTARRIVSTTAR